MQLLYGAKVPPCNKFLYLASVGQPLPTFGPMKRRRKFPASRTLMEATKTKRSSSPQMGDVTN